MEPRRQRRPRIRAHTGFLRGEIFGSTDPLYINVALSKGLQHKVESGLRAQQDQSISNIRSYLGDFAGKGINSLLLQNWSQLHVHRERKLRTV